MENQTNGQKGKRATCNKKDIRLRLVIQNICSKDCNIAPFFAEAKSSYGIHRQKHKDCNIFEANMD